MPKRPLASPRLRDPYAIYVDGDRRKPFAIVDPRASDARKPSLNARCIRALFGLAAGMLLTWGLWGSVIR